MRVERRGDRAAHDDGHGGQRVPGQHPPLEVLLAGVPAPDRLGQLDEVRTGPADQRDRLVVGDPVEPCAQVAHLGPTAQPRPRRQERLLDHIFAVALGLQQPPPVGQERPPVAFDDRLERCLGAGRGQPGQPLVGLGAEDGAEIIVGRSIGEGCRIEPRIHRRGQPRLTG